MLRDEKKEDDDWGINQCGRYVIDNTHNTRALKENCSTLEGKNFKIKNIKWENELETEQSVEKKFWDNCS